MEERYARQTMLPEIGEQGQRRLSEASVLIVGIGGLGSAAALYLTGAGVGRIGLADADTVSKSNLQRQVLYTERQIGMPKSAAARERLAALSSHTAFECRPEGITPENARPILDGYDLILDCCDNFPTRYLLDDLCAACRKPWVHGSIGEFYGQVTVFNGRKGRRYRLSPAVPVELVYRHNDEPYNVDYRRHCRAYPDTRGLICLRQGR